MTGAEASAMLAFLGAVIAVPAALSLIDFPATKTHKVAIAFGIICLLPAFVRLWVAAVAG